MIGAPPTDFLTRLVARAFDDPPAIEPRLSSIFEAPVAGIEPDAGDAIFVAHPSTHGDASPAASAQSPILQTTVPPTFEIRTPHTTPPSIATPPPPERARKEKRVEKPVDRGYKSGRQQVSAIAEIAAAAHVPTPPAEPVPRARAPLAEPATRAPARSVESATRARGVGSRPDTADALITSPVGAPARVPAIEDRDASRATPPHRIAARQTGESTRETGILLPVTIRVQPRAAATAHKQFVSAPSQHAGVTGASPPNVVNVTIGRLEVRNPVAPAPAAAKLRSQPKTLSLDDYLKRRSSP